MLKLSKTAIRELTKRYRTVLVKCFLVALALGASSGALAADVTLSVEGSDVAALNAGDTIGTVDLSGYATTGSVTAEQNRAEGVETILATSTESIGESVGGNFDVDGTFTKTSYKVNEETPLKNISDTDTLVQAIGKLDNAKASGTELAAETARAEAAEGALDARVTANTTAIATKANSADLVAEAARAGAAEGALDARVTANTTAIAAKADATALTAEQNRAEGVETILATSAESIGESVGGNFDVDGTFTKTSYKVDEETALKDISDTDTLVQAIGKLDNAKASAADLTDLSDDVDDLSDRMDDAETAIAGKADATALTAEQNRAEGVETILATSAESIGESVGGNFDVDGTFTKTSYKVDEETALKDISDTDTLVQAIGKLDNAKASAADLTDLSDDVDDLSDRMDDAETAIAGKADATALTAEQNRAEGVETILATSAESLGEAVGGNFDVDGTFAKSSYKVDEETALKDISDTDTLVQAIGKLDNAKTTLPEVVENAKYEVTTPAPDKSQYEYTDPEGNPTDMNSDWTADDYVATSAAETTAGVSANNPTLAYDDTLGANDYTYVSYDKDGNPTDVAGGTGVSELTDTFTTSELGGHKNVTASSAKTGEIDIGDYRATDSSGNEYTISYDDASGEYILYKNGVETTDPAVQGFKTDLKNAYEGDVSALDARQNELKGFYDDSVSNYNKVATVLAADQQTVDELNTWEQEWEDASSDYNTDAAVHNAEVATYEESLSKVIDDKVNAGVEVEKTRAEAAEATLQDKIDDEQARAEAAEEALQGNIDAEKTRAEGAEATLQGNIDAEKARAEAAEAALQGSVDAEQARAEGVEEVLATAAESLGESVGGNFDTDGTFAKSSYKVDEETALKDISDSDTLVQAIGKLDNAKASETELAAETARATAAEATLQDNIDAEQARAEAAEATLQDNIDAEQARAEAAEATLQDNIDAEQARAEAAEATLQDNIDAETARATAAEATLQGNIDAEQARAEAAEATLQGNIEAEQARAEAAETTLQGNIDAEQARAIAAEDALGGRITVEEARAKAAEQALDERVTTNAEAIRDLDNAVGDRNYTSTNYVSGGSDLTTAISALDAGVGELAERTESLEDRTEALEGRTSKLERKTNKYHREMKSGFASLAALSALVPNARAAGDTQLAVGTGYYRGTTGFALGAFQHVNDDILLHLGASYAGNGSATFRGGATIGF